MKIESEYVKNEPGARALSHNRNIAHRVYFADAGVVSGVGSTPQEAVRDMRWSYRILHQEGLDSWWGSLKP